MKNQSLHVDSTRRIGRALKTWVEVIAHDIIEGGIVEDMIVDLVDWKSGAQKANPRYMGQSLQW